MPIKLTVYKRERERDDRRETREDENERHGVNGCDSTHVQYLSYVLPWKFANEPWIGAGAQIIEDLLEFSVECCLKFFCEQDGWG